MTTLRWIGADCFGRHEWRPYDGLALIVLVAINDDPTMTVIVSFAINDERILPS